MIADPRKRRLVLGALLLATLAAVVFAPDDEKQAPPPRERRVGAAAQPAATVDRTSTTERDTPLALPELTPVTEDIKATEDTESSPPDPFRVTSWVVAPPPPPTPEPTAPPLPFKYLGKLIDGGSHIVFLSDKNNYLVAREGDRIDAWRVEEITPKRMTFLYEPLKKRQELVIGSDDPGS